MLSCLSTSSSHCSWMGAAKHLCPVFLTTRWPPCSQAGFSFHCFSLTNFSMLCCFACFCLYHGAISAFLNALYPGVHHFWQCPWVWNSPCSIPNKVSFLWQNWGVQHSWDLLPAQAEHQFHQARAGAGHAGSPFPEWHLPGQQRRGRDSPIFLAFPPAETWPYKWAG